MYLSIEYSFLNVSHNYNLFNVYAHIVAVFKPHLLIKMIQCVPSVVYSSSFKVC